MASSPSPPVNSDSHFCSISRDKELHNRRKCIFSSVSLKAFLPLHTSDAAYTSSDLGDPPVPGSFCLSPEIKPHLNANSKIHTHLSKAKNNNTCLWLTLSQMMRCCLLWLFVLEEKAREALPVPPRLAGSTLQPVCLVCPQCGLGEQSVSGSGLCFRRSRAAPKINE